MEVCTPMRAVMYLYIKLFGINMPLWFTVSFSRFAEQEGQEAPSWSPGSGLLPVRGGWQRSSTNHQDGHQSTTIVSSLNHEDTLGQGAQALALPRWYVEHLMILLLGQARWC